MTDKEKNEAVDRALALMEERAKAEIRKNKLEDELRKLK